MTRSPFSTLAPPCDANVTQYLFGYSGTSATEDLALAAPFLGGAELGCGVDGGDARKQVFELDLGVWTCVACGGRARGRARGRRRHSRQAGPHHT